MSAVPNLFDAETRRLAAELYGPRAAQIQRASQNADLKKKCLACKTRKPLNEFPPSRNNKLGVMGRCKVCHARLSKSPQGTPTHTSWRKMRERCTNPNATQWKWYGGKGVVVCERWGSFDNFLADMGERPAGMTIDRIDSNGNYEPSNCRWADHLTQVRNQEKTLRFGGVTLREICEKRNLSFEAVYQRLTSGVPFDEAIAPGRREAPPRAHGPDGRWIPDHGVIERIGYRPRKNGNPAPLYASIKSRGG